MEKGTNMVTHVNNIKTIAEHLEAINDEVAGKFLVMILISSLPNEYNNLITTLETMAEYKLSWTYVRDRVIHEYDRKIGGGNQKETPQDALFCEKPSKQYHPKKFIRNVIIIIIIVQSLNAITAMKKVIFKDTVRKRNLMIK